ncbi:hypothetical protein [Oscillibacter sp. PC13]|uniref:hypothetical protein n=1 Tax=Oscillibacter sp. PC13 TaxID=1855299 RepID=UPI000B86A94A|nr:hypothetical protein [Oscillibacter sp. PC13]
MGGYTFFSFAKNDPALSTISIIVTTQSDSDADEVTALSHCVEDFVTRPYKAEIPLNRVSSISRFHETAAMINQFQYARLTRLYSKAFFTRRPGIC